MVRHTFDDYGQWCKLLERIRTLPTWPKEMAYTFVAVTATVAGKAGLYRRMDEANLRNFPIPCRLLPNHTFAAFQPLRWSR